MFLEIPSSLKRHLHVCVLLREFGNAFLKSAKLGTTTLGMTAFSILTFSTTTLRITTFRILRFFVTLCINDA